MAQPKHFTGEEARRADDRYGSTSLGGFLPRQAIASGETFGGMNDMKTGA